MSIYTFPEARTRPTAEPKTAYLIASGDLRESANLARWAVQKSLEDSITTAFADLGWTVKRANDIDPELGHGFIRS